MWPGFANYSKNLDLDSAGWKRFCILVAPQFPNQNRLIRLAPRTYIYYIDDIRAILNSVIRNVGESTSTEKLCGLGIWGHMVL